MQVVREARLQPTPIGLSSTRYAWWVRFNQIFWYWPTRLLTTTLMSRRVRIDLRADDLSSSERYILASNHQSLADPFIICSELPGTLWPRLGVFRYFAHSGLFENFIMRWLLLAFGGFPTRPVDKLPYGVEAAQAYLSRGQTVVIFPEGRRALPGTVRARGGVARLAADPNTRVIPVRLEWRRAHGWTKRSYQLTVGKPLPPTQTAEAVLEAIYALPLA